MEGSFYTVDANITNVSAVTLGTSGNKDGYVTITFTYSGTTTTNGIAEIYFGLYISKPGDIPDKAQARQRVLQPGQVDHSDYCRYRRFRCNHFRIES